MRNHFTIAAIRGSYVHVHFLLSFSFHTIQLRCTRRPAIFLCLWRPAVRVSVWVPWPTAGEETQLVSLIASYNTLRQSVVTKLSSSFIRSLL